MESVPEPCSHSAGATPGPWEACPPGGGIVLPPVICHSTLLLKADILLCHAFRNVCSAHKHLKICVSYALSAQERLSPLQAGAHALHGDGYGAEIEAQAQRGCRSQLWPAGLWARDSFQARPAEVPGAQRTGHRGC